MKKNNYRNITVAEMSPHIHSFLPHENKVDKISNWLINWITLSLECGKIQIHDLLPSKSDLAYHIGVSKGTIQNVYRKLEDLGFLESKQRIGTYIKDRTNKAVAKKLTSKRDLAVEIVKKYLLENNYKVGDIIISIRKLAELTGISNSTMRVAVQNLVMQGILDNNNAVIKVKKINYSVNKIQTKTLVEKVAEDIKKYMQENLKSGEKLPANSVLTKKFKVSLKTIHDAVKLLAKEGLLYTRRGQYGTIFLGQKQDKHVEYFYEKVVQKIKQYIVSNGQIGEKLPSIKHFAQMYETSEKTIKKALDNLADEGYITFSRGRYGGTFVLDIPEKGENAYKWLAISSDYIPN